MGVDPFDGFILHCSDTFDLLESGLSNLQLNLYTTLVNDNVDSIDGFQ